MSDTNERSAASAGSVAGEPVAWMHVSGGLSLGVFKHVDPRLRHFCIPLYRSPTLTDAERSAIKEASEFYIGTRTGVALGGLLERLK